VALLNGDVATESLLPVDGAIPIGRPEPNPALLERWQADDTTSERELARLRTTEVLL